jgi:MraZ protein
MGVVKRQMPVFYSCMTLRASMFIGQHQLYLGRDRRLVVPAPFREILEDGAYVTRGFENNLLIMSDMVFQDIYERVVSLNIADPLARLLLRLILGNASKLNMDAAGHILIPEILSSFASLEKEIILVGQGDYLELWTPAHWEEQSTILRDTVANAGRFAQLDLAMQKNHPGTP